MKAFYVNDTSKVPHAGCIAVNVAHRKMMAECGVKVVHSHYLGEGEDLFCGDEAKSLQRVLNSRWAEYIKKCDVVIVNGEGTIHHDGGSHLLALIAASIKLNKKVFLINCVLQDVSVFKWVFPKITGITVREPLSGKVAQGLGGEPIVLPDSIIEADFSNKKTIDFNNEIVVGDGHWERTDVLNALADFGENRKKFILCGKKIFSTWKNSIANLRTAQIYVTGRHHGIYLAALAGIPFVALPSNTHKVESLIHWSGSNIPICTNYKEILDAIDYCKQNPEVFRKFSAFIKSFKPLNHLKLFPEFNNNRKKNFIRFGWRR